MKRTTTGRLRADALRNRTRILAAARESFVELGAEAPLDEIARRAGVGNATLYRHFADRDALLHEVVLTVMTRAADAVEPEADDPFVALCQFVHAAADERIAVLCPLLAGAADYPDLSAEKERLVRGLQALVDRAHEASRLRDDVSLGDLMMALAQLTRPVAGADWSTTSRLTHRNLQLFLDGLEAPARSSLPGDPATLADLSRK
ncbi:TetR/AcrR family transcriptional regulator [Actinopolymorpha pittospori]|uniref:AcrR family transcriptional regulator n=1 Tax=Actinopolymorpha pittospori TaxID=648752 RepID=A0A927MQP1_9ACTN|nr:TetR/AcrR family transcriptional regulator [Actinopolymorpha pittospori]MBE1604447.1 AcrR family transcriptional regulator [Actinopolymorpha pittospori]